MPFILLLLLLLILNPLLLLIFLLLRLVISSWTSLHLFWAAGVFAAGPAHREKLCGLGSLMEKVPWAQEEPKK